MKSQDRYACRLPTVTLRPRCCEAIESEMILNRIPDSIFPEPERFLVPPQGLFNLKSHL